MAEISICFLILLWFNTACKKRFHSLYRNETGKKLLAAFSVVVHWIPGMDRG